MKYTVEVKSNTGEPIADYPNCSQRGAVQIARREAKNTANQVFVSWLRSSDGQHGYLNPDGNHAITGKVWF